MSKSRETAARLAGQIEKTFGERGSVYGDPEDNFSNIAGFWNAWIHARYKPGELPLLDAFDVAHMSSLIKKARLAHSPDHEDSSLDDAVYTLLGTGIGDDMVKGAWGKRVAAWRDIDRAIRDGETPAPIEAEPPADPAKTAADASDIMAILEKQFLNARYPAFNIKPLKPGEPLAAKPPLCPDCGIQHDTRRISEMTAKEMANALRHQINPDLAGAKVWLMKRYMPNSRDFTPFEGDLEWLCEIAQTNWATDRSIIFEFDPRPNVAGSVH